MVFKFTHSSLRGEYGHSTSNVGAIQTGPEKLNDDFSGTAEQFSSKFGNLYRPFPKIKLYKWYIQESNGTPSSDPNTKCLENGLTGFQLNFNHLYSQLTQILFSRPKFSKYKGIRRTSPRSWISHKILFFCEFAVTSIDTPK